MEQTKKNSLKDLLKIFKFKINCLLNGPILKLDWVIFFLIYLFCFFCFSHGDILGVNSSSISYLAGHVKDFYDFNPAQKTEALCNYLPSTYILFAIWNIPLYLLKLVSFPITPKGSIPLIAIFWFKLLPNVFYFAIAGVLFKISKFLGFTQKNSKLVMFIFLTTPIALFSPAIFGQYDVFTIFFIVLGLYFYFKKNILKFVFCFSVAITFKYFALLFFFPLLFLVEKKVTKILKYCFLLLVPFLLEVLFYINSVGFKKGVFGFSAVNYIFESELKISDSLGIILMLFFWVLINGWAYFKNFELNNADETIKWGLYFCNLVCFLIFGLSIWHPQWLVFMAPFFVLAAVINKHSNFFLILDGLIFLFFTLFCTSFFHSNVDESLLLHGIIPNLIAKPSNITPDLTSNLTYSMAYFFKFKSSAIEKFLFSCFSALLFISAVFKHPKFTKKGVFFNEEIEKEGLILRIRLFSIFCWVLPAFFCLVHFKVTDLKFMAKATDFGIRQGSLEPLKKEDVLKQAFVVPKNVSNVQELRVCFNNADKSLDSVLEISLEDEEKKEVLFKKDYNLKTFKQKFPTRFKLGKIKVTPNKEYVFKFKPKEVDANFPILINKTIDKNSKRFENYDLVRLMFGLKSFKINDIEQNNNMCISVIGN